MRSEDRERAAADGHQCPSSSGSNEPRSPCVGAGAGTLEMDAVVLVS